MQGFATRFHATIIYKQLAMSNCSAQNYNPFTFQLFPLPYRGNWY